MNHTIKLNADNYVERDLSWMYFNHRILLEATNPHVPLLERVSFLGIYSNNLDEFFRVRMATLGRIAECTDKSLQRESRNARELIDHINKLNNRYARQYKLAAIKDKEHQRLPVSSLQAIYDEFSVLSTAQRMQMYHLKADRADVIIPAARIFLAIAQVAKADFVHVPVIGLADGIIHSLCASPSDSCSS